MRGATWPVYRVMSGQYRGARVRLRNSFADGAATVVLVAPFFKRAREDTIYLFPREVERLEREIP